MFVKLMRELLEWDGPQLYRDVKEAAHAALVDERGAPLWEFALDLSRELGLILDCSDEYPDQVWVDGSRVRALLGLVENWDDADLARMQRFFYTHAALKPGDGELTMAQAWDLLAKHDGDGAKPLEEPDALRKRLEAQREQLNLDARADESALEILRAVPAAVDALDSDCGAMHGELDVDAAELLVELALRWLGKLKPAELARWRVTYRTKDDPVWRESRVQVDVDEAGVAEVSCEQLVRLEDDAWQWRIECTIPDTPALHVRARKT